MRAAGAAGIFLIGAALLSATEYSPDVFRSIQTLEKVEAENPANPATELSLAAAFLQLRQEELFREAIENALKMDPNSAEGHYLKGRFALDARGDAQGALAEFRKSAELDPGNAKTAYYSGVCLYHLREFEQARSEFRQAALQDKSSRPLRAEAEAELALGAAGQALAPASRALQLEPKSPEDLLIAGRIYSKLNQPDKAMAMLAEAAHLEPYWDLPHLYLGRLYLERTETQKKGKDELAVFNRLREADMPKARRDAPAEDHPKSQPQAKSRKELDQFGRAILAESPLEMVRGGEKFLAFFPDSEFREKTLELEFQAFQQREDYAAAKRVGRQILTLNRWDATVLASLANLVANRNDASSFGEAEEYAERAVQSTEATERPVGMETPEFIRWKYAVLSSAYSAEGVLALRRGEPAIAIKKLREAIELRPAASGVDYLRLGEAPRSTNDRVGARNAFSQAEALGPSAVTETAKRLEARAEDKSDESALRHFAMARTLEKKGDLSGAAEEYEQAVQAEPTLAEGFHNLGLTYYRLQKYERAKQCLDKAAELKPELAGGELFLGLADFRLGEFNEAAHHLTQALRTEPRNREAYLGLIRVETAMGRFSLETASSAVKLFPADAEVNNAVGQACLERVREIARDVNESGLETPSFSWLSLRRAQERQDSESIERWASKVSGVEEPAAVREFDSVSSLLKQAFDSVLANSPDSAAAHSIRGYLHESRGETDAALKDYRSAGDHFAAGRLLAQNVRLSEAEIEFKKAMESDPENYRASADLARLYLQENAAERATPLLESLIKKFPTDAELWADLGKAQSAAGDRESAVRSLKRAVANDPSMNRVHYQLAMIYRKMGQEELAREELQSFQGKANRSK